MKTVKSGLLTIRTPTYYFFLTILIFRGHKGIAGQGSSDKPFGENTAVDWVPDPNEPTYCLCNQVTR